MDWEWFVFLAVTAVGAIPLMYISFPFLILPWMSVIVGLLISVRKHSFRPVIYGVLLSIPISFSIAFIYYLCCLKISIF